MKKQVLIYATCQGTMLHSFLNSCEQFRQQFDIVDSIHNYELIRTNRNFLEQNNQSELIKSVDVFVYQPLDNSYGANATDFLLAQLKPGAIAISIPYVVNTSFWPVITAPTVDFDDNWHHPQTITKNSEVIDCLIEQHLGVQDILTLYNSRQINFDYTQRYQSTMNTLQKKEQNTTVKVHDYIEANHKKIKLFTYPSHPTYFIIAHMANQILQCLGLDAVNYIGDTDHLYHPPIHLPYVTSAQSAFGFEFELDSNGDDYYRGLISDYVLNKTGSHV
jgi:hypothetical protein